MADYLVDRGTLHSADVHVVEAFAQAVARAQALQEMLDAEGLVKDGRAHPAARLLEGAVGTIRNTSMLLGLAPLARQKLTAEVRNREGHGHEEGEWQRLLKR